MSAIFLLNLPHTPTYIKLDVILNNPVVLTLMEYNAGAGPKS